MSLPLLKAFGAAIDIEGETLILTWDRIRYHQVIWKFWVIGDRLYCSTNDKVQIDIKITHPVSDPLQQLIHHIHKVFPRIALTSTGGMDLVGTARDMINIFN